MSKKHNFTLINIYMLNKFIVSIQSSQMEVVASHESPQI